MPEQPLAAVLVRNTARHDARVLRCATQLRSLGYAPLIVGVTAEGETAEHSAAEGIPILRLTPRAPFARSLRALRRGERGDGGGAGGGGGAIAPSPSGSRGLPRRAYRLLRTLSYYRQGIGTMRRMRPAIVHCNDYNTMWIGIGAKLLAGSAVVYDSHELWPDRNGRTEPRGWLLLCEWLFVRAADSRLATSPGHAQAIARRHRVEPPRVVRNIPERRATGAVAAAPERTLAYVGAVTGSRGLEQAIAALPHAAGVTLRILGPGVPAYRESLVRLAAAEGVAERVRFEDPVPPWEVVESVAGAGAGAALIQPSCLSYALSLPNKVFEYVAAGLPILAADLPVIGPFVERNAIGLTVAPDSPREIAAAMLEIVEPERNRELRAAVRELSEGLTWEREAEGLRRAYADAIAAGGPAR
jgi:glycosyltransferase involved in cell wall biosynthesis